MNPPVPGPTEPLPESPDLATKPLPPPPLPLSLGVAKPKINLKPKQWSSIGVGLVVVGVAMLALSWLQMTPTKRFNKALETSLTTKTLLQEWRSDMPAITISAKSDFTNLRQTKAAISTRTASDGSIEIGYDLISLPNHQNYARYTKYKIDGYDNAAAAEKLLINKWLSNDNDDSLAALGHLDEDVNTPLGEVITGNFDKGFRQTIMKQIKRDAIYTVKDGRRVKEGDRQLWRLAVDIKKDKLVELNNMVAAKLNLNKIDLSRAVSSSVVFIDDNNHIVRVELDHDGQKMIINYSQFNQSFDIHKPPEVLSQDESAKLLKQVAELVLGRSL